MEAVLDVEAVVGVEEDVADVEGDGSGRGGHSASGMAALALRWP